MFVLETFIKMTVCQKKLFCKKQLIVKTFSFYMKAFVNLKKNNLGPDVLNFLNISAQVSYIYT